MELAIVELTKLLKYFDYFHKVPWVWGDKRMVPSTHQFLRKYVGYCSMAFLNLVYGGFVIFILLRQLLSFEKDPDMSIEGIFFLLLIADASICTSTCSHLMLFHSQPLGTLFMRLKIAKGRHSQLHKNDWIVSAMFLTNNDVLCALYCLTKTR
jgi:hypothetical protein